MNETDKTQYLTKEGYEYYIEDGEHMGIVSKPKTEEERQENKEITEEEALERTTPITTLIEPTEGTFLKNSKGSTSKDSNDATGMFLIQEGLLNHLLNNKGSENLKKILPKIKTKKIEGKEGIYIEYAQRSAVVTEPAKKNEIIERKRLNTQIEYEKIEGKNLAEIKRELSLEQKLKIVTDVLKGLAELEELGYVHGDIKPENIMITDEENDTKIVDLEMAKPITNNMLKGAKGISIGYASPEKLNLYKVETLQSEVFSMGMTIMELLFTQNITNNIIADYKIYERYQQVEEVFNNKELNQDVKDKKIREKEEELIDVYEMAIESIKMELEDLDSIDQGIKEILLKATEINPENRYKSIKELKEAVENWIKSKN